MPLVFNTRDEKLHTELKKPIAPFFSLTNALTFERFVEEVERVFFGQLDKRFVQSQATCDLGDWLQFFTFEVMGTITFSKRYGFLEKGVDEKGMLEAIWTFLGTAAPVSSKLCF
jgi:hypothetical protein